MKALHLADLHIREKDMEEIARILSFIVAQAQQEAPDVIIIAGDVFDSRDVKIDSQAGRAAVSFVASLADIAPVAIIIGTPSHDGQAPAILAHVRGTFPVVVAEKPMQILLSAGRFETQYGGDDGYQPYEEDAIITLIPQPTKQWFQTTSGIEGADREIGQAMSGLFTGLGAEAANYPGVPHILVGHWNVNGCRLANGQIRTGMDIEVSVDQMNMGGFDLGCLGHIHIAQVLGEKYFYSGPVYATKIDEDGPKGFYVHEIVDTAKEWHFEHRFIETPCKRIVRFKEDRTADYVPFIMGPEIIGAHVRYEITEWQDIAVDKAGTEKRLLDFGALSAEVKVSPVPRETIRAAAVLEAQTLRDEFSEMAKLRGETIDPEILAMADRLETLPGEELLKEVAA